MSARSRTGHVTRCDTGRRTGDGQLVNGLRSLAMSTVRVVAERTMAAPPDVVYACIANYQEHHRPGGFLPPSFSDFRVERGGVGAGTVISFKMKLGGQTRSSTQRVSEPEPGRVLVESGHGVTTTFSVQPEGAGCRVRFDTLLEARGLEGILTRLFAPRLLQPVYQDELRRLEAYAQELTASPAGRGRSTRIQVAGDAPR